MSARKKGITLTIGVLLAFAALVTGIFVAQHMHSKKKIDSSQFHGTLLQQPRQIEQFALVDINNATFDNQNLQGQWTMVFFGFTNCGYLCPTTMSELAKMYHFLEQKNVKPLPQVILISVDPDRDTIEKLKQYVTSFNPHFQGARGDDDAIKKMSHEMGIAYSKQPINGSNENYDVQHSGAIILFNPQGELVAFFTTPHKAELLAQDYQLLTA